MILDGGDVGYCAKFFPQKLNWDDAKSLWEAQINCSTCGKIKLEIKNDKNLKLKI